MLVFWMVAISFCVVAVAFVVAPMRIRRNTGNTNRMGLNVALYRDRISELEKSRSAGEISDEEFAQLEKDLQLVLLADDGDEVEPVRTESSVPVAAAAFVVVFSVFLYGDFGFSLGSLNDLLLAEEMQAAPHDVPQMRVTVEKLARRLQQQPDNDRGWFLLAQSWRSLSEYEEASRAFQRLVEKFPNDAALAANYAEVVFFADGQRFSPRVREAVEQALALDPDNLQMLEFSAMYAYRQGDSETTVALFRRALKSAEGERAELLRRAITRLSGESPTLDAPSQVVSTGRILKVLVELGSGVEAQANDTVYVYARAFAGPPMPLAVQRLTVANLPTLVTLTPAQAMMQGMSLNDFDRVQLVARVSESGIANASPDDYEVFSGEIDMKLEQPVIKLVISDRRG